MFFIAMIVLVNLKLNVNPETSLPVHEVEKALPVIPFDINRPMVFDKANEVVDASIYPLYITVFNSKPIESVTIEDINTKDYSNQNVYIEDSDDPFAYVHFSEFPVSEVVLPNATLEIRGQSSRRDEQKSYKVKLFDKTDKWLGSRVVNLNKHFDDPTRLRNKISFDLFYSLPHMTSMRTYFTEVFIKDLSANMTEYVSYGLFTFIEQPNETFIEGLFTDVNGGLYKAEFFEFYNYQAIKTTSDPGYDGDAFENHLEIRGSNDHRKLKLMLSDLNDFNQDIDDIIKKYFDEENMLTWLASNILLNNYDTSSRNFMLYNPTHTNKWYFLPWDYDKGWSDSNRKILWQRGLSNYWGMVLFNRYFKKEGNYEKFQLIFDDVYGHLQPEDLRPMITEYASVIKEKVYAYPDGNYLTKDKLAYDDDIESLIYLPLSQYKYYYEHIDSPMPFYLGKPVINDTTIDFLWDASYDLQNDPIHYTLSVSKEITFQHKVVYVEDIFLTSYTIPMLEEGLYYWKVEAFDSKKNRMTSFDYVSNNKGETAFGAEMFEVGGDRND